MQLNTISTFIVQLHLEHNKLTSFNFNIMGVVFTALKSLKLSNNRIKALFCDGNTSFPKLEELHLNHNLLTALPENLPVALPSLKTLSLSSNKLDNITDTTFGQGLEILDLSNNDIGFLPPGLSNITTLKELVVYGNRFRVPRPNVVEQGTQAILEFLRRRNTGA
jgi:Leucine-rich repeat (LRR) protein